MKFFFRSIRVMAVDHGQFSFIDVKHGVWPIVLVTHPKTVTLVTPGGKSPVPSSKYIRYDYRGRFYEI